MRAGSQSAKSNRAAVIHRFELKERAREQMRFFEFSSLAGIYANNRCNGDIDAAYRELIKALDDVGFLGSRILYLDPEGGPPYFLERRTSPEAPLVPRPHKQNPLITKKFIEAREQELGWIIVRDAYLAKSWVWSLCAARWLQSKGITPPGSIGWSLKVRETARAEPALVADQRRSWKLKSGNRLTRGEAAICDALNTLWPSGNADHKARARDKSINDWFRKQGKSTVSSRTIQRAFSKIAYN
jgi:hypothetical protein